MQLKFSNARLIQLLIFLSISGISMNAQKQQSAPDPHSYANSDEVRIRHLSLDLSVLFESKTLTGKAILYLHHIKRTTSLTVDTRGLLIEKITLDENESPAKYFLGNEIPIFGAPLTISITPKTKYVTIHYSTSPDAGALQWLEPSQTAGKEKPFLYTQSQAILARSWVPCMDGPGVRMTYSATIRTTGGVLALMSASNPQSRSDDGVYRFEMKQPIPSYLLALAVGDLEFRQIGKRSGVYAEAGILNSAAYEFADIESMIDAAETMYGEYRWERYDLLVLPPSFPFGGMENPRLTFATPTIIAGDRSLVSLVAHELAHSWSGNLVTNATWNDFWLNEGFTVYFEQRIMEKVYGRTYSEMLAALSLKDLKSTIATMGNDNPDTRLKLDLTGRDPDDGVTDIAYDKGYFFLRLCEETFGRDRWDDFLRRYFNDNAFTSMTTAGFLMRMEKEFSLKKNSTLASTLGIDEWINGTGLPKNCPVPISEEFVNVSEQVDVFLRGTQASQLTTNDWTTHHWLYFLRTLPDSLTLEKIIELDYAFNFTRSGNAEINSEWFKRCIASQYETAYGAIKKFLINIGRRKLIKPLYEELAKSESGKAWALEVYAMARPGYHSVSQNTIDGILKYGK